MQESNSLLPGTWQVPPVFRRRLGQQSGRQRIMESDGHLLVILHAPPTAKDVDRQGRFFWRSPDGNWQSSERGNGIVAMQSHLAEFGSAIERCEQLEDAAQGSRDYFEVLREIAPLLRTTRHLAETLQAARQAANLDADLINFRDESAKLQRRTELLASDAKNGMDFALARQAEKQAEVSTQLSLSAHRLNLFVAFFFPLATLCAIFSTNLKSGLESMPAPWPLALVLGVGVILGSLLTLAICRKPNRIN